MQHVQQKHQKKVICKHFSKGNCRNGNRCRFIHEGVGESLRNEQATSRRSDGGVMNAQLSQNIQCLFYLSGHCRNGHHCGQIHSPDEREKFQFEQRQRLEELNSQQVHEQNRVMVNKNSQVGSQNDGKK